MIIDELTKLAHMDLSCIDGAFGFLSTIIINGMTRDRLRSEGR
jgi:hypothetical protein